MSLNKLPIFRKILICLLTTNDMNSINFTDEEIARKAIIDLGLLAAGISTRTEKIMIIENDIKAINKKYNKIISELDSALKEYKKIGGDFNKLNMMEINQVKDDFKKYIKSNQNEFAEQISNHLCNTITMFVASKQK